MKRYALVLGPALAGALFGASAIAVLVKPADAEAIAAIKAGEASPSAKSETPILTLAPEAVIGR